MGGTLPLNRDVKEVPGNKSRRGPARGLYLPKLPPPAGGRGDGHGHPRAPIRRVIGKRGGKGRWKKLPSPPQTITLGWFSSDCEAGGGRGRSERPDLSRIGPILSTLPRKRSYKFSRPRIGFGRDGEAAGPGAGARRGSAGGQRDGQIARRGAELPAGCATPRLDSRCRRLDR